MDGPIRNIYLDMAEVCFGRGRISDFPSLHPIADKYELIGSPTHLQIQPKNIKSPKDFLGSGWKFHASVEFAQLGEAWEITMRELLKLDKPLAAKIIAPRLAGRINDENNASSGKFITLYDNGMSTATTMEFLKTLETRLIQQSIGRGVAVKNDRNVQGSSYFSYRNDRTINGEYSTEGGYNTGKHHDPFIEFQIGPSACVVTQAKSPSP